MSATDRPGSPNTASKRPRRRSSVAVLLLVSDTGTCPVGTGPRGSHGAIMPPRLGAPAVGGRWFRPKIGRRALRNRDVRPMRLRSSAATIEADSRTDKGAEMAAVAEPELDPEKLEQFVFKAVEEVGATLNAAL